MMIKVLCAGTFDFFHQGHRFFLEQAKSLGDELYVIVARDSSVHRIKGFYPTHTQEERIEMIEQQNIADQALLGEETDFLALPKKINPDIFALGYDQYAPEKKIKKYFPDAKIIRIEAHYPEKFKSSFFRK